MSLQKKHWILISSVVVLLCISTGMFLLDSINKRNMPKEPEKIYVLPESRKSRSQPMDSASTVFESIAVASDSLPAASSLQTKEDSPTINIFTGDPLPKGEEYAIAYAEQLRTEIKRLKNERVKNNRKREELRDVKAFSSWIENVFAPRMKSVDADVQIIMDTNLDIESPDFFAERFPDEEVRSYYYHRLLNWYDLVDDFAIRISNLPKHSRTRILYEGVEPKTSTSVFEYIKSQVNKHTGGES